MDKKKSVDKKINIGKYGIFAAVIIAVALLALLFFDSYTDKQPALKVEVGASTFDAINQPMQVETMFEKTKNNYDTPVQTAKQRKVNPITVSKGQKIELQTEKMNGVKTNLIPPYTDNVDISMWKDGVEEELEILEGDIFTDGDLYKLSFDAPKDSGEYIVSVTLDYNKSKMRYTFKINVK